MNQKELLDKLTDKNSLNEVQEYIKNVFEIRGFNDQSIQNAMLLLTEEVGELAKAIRKTETDIATDINRSHNYETVESELADVFIVLVGICNSLNIDIFQAVKDKEIKNIERNWR